MFSPRTALCVALLTLGSALPACSRFEAPHESAPGAELASQAQALAEAPRALPGPRQLIRTVTLELQVEAAAAARNKAERAALSLGGFVEGLESTHYPGMQRTQLTLRVPKDKLDSLLGQLRQLGSVQHESQAVEDVTRKVVDADARLRNLARTEERLLALLASSGANLSDVLAVERELSRVREEHEVLSAELRAVSEQVALSTVKLGLSQERDPEPPPSAWSPFRRLGRNAGNIVMESASALVGFTAAILSALLYVLPWSPLVLLVLWLAARARARWRRRRG